MSRMPAAKVFVNPLFILLLVVAINYFVSAKDVELESVGEKRPIQVNSFQQRLAAGAPVEALSDDTCPRTPFNQSDYLLLVHSDYITFCTSQGHGCNLTYTREVADHLGSGFTLHGLWPQLAEPRDKHYWPQCCANEKFDSRLLSASLLGKMYWGWPKITSFDLWGHEWEKHGTCAKYAIPSIPLISTQTDYFQVTINLFNQMSLTHVLADAGYPASDLHYYNVGELKSALENRFRVRPLMSYYKDYDNTPFEVNGMVSSVRMNAERIANRQKYLGFEDYDKLVSEIWFCIDKTKLTVMSCPSNLKITGHEANDSDSVLLPSIDWIPGGNTY